MGNLIVTSLSQSFFSFLLYVSLMAVAVFKRENIFYLFVLTSPLYEHFKQLFFVIHVAGVSFRMKPFLFLTFVLFFLFFKNADRKKIRFFLSKEHMVIVLAFAGLCLLSFVFSLMAKNNSLTELNMLINVSVVFLLPVFLREVQLPLKKIFVCFSAVSSLFSLYHIFHIYFPQRFFIIRWEDQIFPNFLMMVFPFIALGYFCSWQKKIRYFFLFSCLCAAFSIFLSASKGALLGLSFTLPFFMLYLFITVKGRRKAVMADSCLLLGAMVFLFLLTGKMFPEIKGEYQGLTTVLTKTRVNTVKSKDEAVNLLPNDSVRTIYAMLSADRTIPWRESLKRIRSNPLKGYGFNFELKKNFGLHSIYFTALIGGGIIGFLLFIGGLVALFLALIKKISADFCWQRKAFFAAVMSSVVGWMIHGLVQTTLNEYVVWMVIACVFIEPVMLVCS